MCRITSGHAKPPVADACLVEISALPHDRAILAQGRGLPALDSRMSRGTKGGWTPPPHLQGAHSASACLIVIMHMLVTFNLGCDGENQILLKRPPDDLGANWQSGSGAAARNRNSRQTCQID